MPKIGSIATCLAIAMLLASCQAAEQPEKTVQQFMAQDVQPTSDIYWKAVQYISDDSGSRDIVPQTDAEWQRVQDAATQIVGYAELLKTPAYAEGRGGDWIQFADSLAEVGKLAEQAAAEKNPDKVFEVGGTLYSVCSACHLIYPATVGPEVEEAEAAAAANE
jgi:cytochrome c556